MASVRSVLGEPFGGSGVGFTFITRSPSNFCRGFCCCAKLTPKDIFPLNGILHDQPFWRRLIRTYPAGHSGSPPFKCEKYATSFLGPNCAPIPKCLALNRRRPLASTTTSGWAPRRVLESTRFSDAKKRGSPSDTSWTRISSNFTPISKNLSLKIWALSLHDENRKPSAEVYRPSKAEVLDFLGKQTPYLKDTLI